MMGLGAETPRIFSQIWQFPPRARFGRIIPKEKIYQQVGVKQTFKSKFIDEIAQIRWAYKLSADTINLAATHHIDELQIIRIVLKGHTCSEDVLKMIDKAIPHPVIFILQRSSAEGEQIRYVAALKKPGTDYARSWHCSAYLRSAWISTESTTAVPLPTAINLTALYHRMLTTLLPIPPRETESIEQTLIRLGEIQQLEKSLRRLAKQMAAEKQFNRKVDINQKIRQITQQLRQLRL